MSFYCDLFKTVLNGPDFINGLAIPYNQVYENGRFRKVYDKYYGLINSKLLANIGFDDTDNNTRALFRSPGKYTGEMRKVVQALYSQGKLCAYDYKFNICHGVYTAADASKWVIQINGDGVKAAPLPIVTHLSDFDWLGYTPDYDADLFNVSNPDVIDLTDNIGVNDFYSKDRVFLSCGWAFNTTGSEAQNVVTTTDINTGVTTGYRYKLSISETSNKPSSISLTLEESGEFALSKYKGMKVPADTEDRLEQTINQSGQGTIGTFSGPRYVFYDGNTPVVVRSEGIAGNQTSTANDTFIGVSGGLTVGGIGGVYLSNNRNDYGNGTSKTYYTSGTKTIAKEGTIVDGFIVKEDISGANLKVKEYKRTTVEKVIINFVEYIGWPNYRLEGWDYTVSGQERQGVSYCIVPLWEREAVYQYEWEEKYPVPKNYGWSYGVGNKSCIKTETSPNCFRIDYIYNSSPSYELDFSARNKVVADSFIPVVGDTICNGSNLTPYVGFSTSSSGENSATLSIVASGNINKKIWTDNTINSDIVSYNGDTDSQNPQWMYSHKDNSKLDTLFCSNKINSVGGSDAFILNVDESIYPISMLDTVNKLFWVGEP